MNSHVFAVTLVLIMAIAMSYMSSGFAVENIYSAANPGSLSGTDNVKEVDNELILLSEAIENRIEKATAILELTSRLPAMRTMPFLNEFSTNFHGIPPDVDMEKRAIGQELLLKYPEEFVSFLYLMPNGTVYLIEPYARQQNLSTSDLSYREYYKGMIETNDTFLSNVITALTSGRNQAQLAVPIFDTQGNGNNATSASLIGVVSAGLNLESFNKILQSVKLSNNERIVLLDSNGTKIADSDIKRQSSLLNRTQDDVSFKQLQSFMNAVKGESGTLKEAVNGTQVEIQYTPVKVVQRNWVLLSFGSSEPSFTTSADSNTTQTINTTMKIPSNDTLLNSNTTNQSNSLNSTVPEQVDPSTVNGSNVGKI